MALQTSVDGRLDAWLALLQAQAVLTDRVAAELMDKTGLPLAWHEVLVRLARAGSDGERMQELARAVLLSKSGLTRLADRMESAGLIERRKCPTDRRGTYVALTDRGRLKLRSSTPVVRRAVEARFAGPLSAEEVVTLRSLLRKVTEGSAYRAEDCG